MHNIAITTECTADLPAEILEEFGIDVIYYDMETDKGLFRDTIEVSPDDVIEYMSDGSKKLQGVVPNANDYRAFFERNLKKADEIIHICVSKDIAKAYDSATLALTKLGMDAGKVHIVDSKSLSSGQGFVTLKAAMLRDEGRTVTGITQGIEELIPRINTSFMVKSADYLYYNGKVSKTVMNICRTFRVHPVLTVKDGKLIAKSVFIGNYDRVYRSYIKFVLKRAKNIDKGTAFLTHSGCPHEMIEKIRLMTEEKVGFENLMVNRASATISCNCGPLSFGIIFLEGGTL